MALRRITKELKDVEANHTQYCTHYSVAKVGDNWFNWKAAILGPADSPYDSGQFVLNITFPQDYPFKPMKVKFETKIYHCNVNDNGCISFDILHDNWSPALTVSQVLLSIQSLIADPNADDPLRPDISRLYKTNRKLHDKRANEMAVKYANAKKHKYKAADIPVIAVFDCKYDIQSKTIICSITLKHPEYNEYKNHVKSMKIICGNCTQNIYINQTEYKLKLNPQENTNTGWETVTAKIKFDATNFNGLSNINSHDWPNRVQILTNENIINNNETEEKHIDDDYDPMKRLKRLGNMMNEYSHIVNNNGKNNKFIDNINVLELSNDFSCALQQQNDAKSFSIVSNQSEHCDISKCIMFKRHYRYRSKYQDNNSIIKLYGTNSSKYDGKYIVRCQIFDKIHCFTQHSVDIGNKLSKKECHLLKDASDDDEKKDFDETAAVNRRWIQLKRIISNKLNTHRNALGSIRDRMSKKYNHDMLISGCQFQYADFEAKENKKQSNNTNDHIQFRNVIVIYPKYKNLKDELISNSISSVCIEQFDNEHTKSEIEWETYYRKKYYTEMSIEHLLVLMIYCNYDELQYKFSQTYRDNSGLQHDNYYHLGKLLKQSVLKFGKSIRDCNVKTFFHGVTQMLVPPEIVGYLGKGIKIYCPLSTSSSIEVAANFTNHNNGLIMQFGGNRSRAKCFSVSWISDYSNENEYLFLQNKNEFQINNIIECKDGYEYEKILNVLKTMNAVMSIDYFENDSTVNIKNSIIPDIIKVIKHQLSIQLPDENWPTIDSVRKYVKDLISLYFNNTKKLSINYSVLEYNYQELFELFCLSEYEWIRTKRLCALFPHVTKFEIKNINLCSQAINDLFQLVNDNNNSWKINGIKRINIKINEDSDLSVSQAKQQYQQQFAQIKDLGIEITLFY